MVLRKSEGDFPAASPGVFLVLGTDTNVGKTLVSSSLVAQGLARGLRVTYFKPAQTGVSGLDDPAGDAVTISGRHLKNDRFLVLTGNWFRDPIDPMTAAQRAGTEISRQELTITLDRLVAESEMLVIEGAGGVLSPFFPDGSGIVPVFATAPWPFHTLLVSHPHLGTLSSTLLSINYLNGALPGPLSLVLVPRPTPDDSLASELNPGILARLLQDIPVSVLKDDLFLAVYPDH